VAAGGLEGPKVTSKRSFTKVRGASVSTSSRSRWNRPTL
jgi:hypothetical protein